MSDWPKVIEFSVAHAICGAAPTFTLARERSDAPEGAISCPVCGQSQALEDLRDDDDAEILQAISVELEKVSGKSTAELAAWTADDAWIAEMAMRSPALRSLLDFAALRASKRERKH